MGNQLQQGIQAAKAGNKEQAFELLMQATQDPTSSAQAWIWLSSVVQDDSERLFCLDNALRTDPNNEVARRGAATLRQKGIFPAPPSPPGTVAPAPGVKPPVVQPPPAASSGGSEIEVIEKQAPPSKTATEGQLSEDEIKAIYQYVAEQLARKKNSYTGQFLKKELEHWKEYVEKHELVKAS